MECLEDKNRFSGRHIGPQVDFSLIRSWLDFCTSHHTRLCQSKASDVASIPGFRVIDCRSRKVDNDKERHTQIQRMNLIYGSSAVTIIAAAGEDPTHGLPGVGKTPRKPQPAIRLGDRTLISANLNVQQQVNASRWSERGWTYQEAYLSTRRLVFTDHMVYFHCRAMHCPETISAPLEALHTDNMQRLRDPVHISRVWPLRGLGKRPSDLDNRIVEYSKKQLSYPSDALSAFEGILARFEVMSPPVRNLCGIPLYEAEDITASLVVGLGWEVWLKNVTDDGAFIFPEPPRLDYQKTRFNRRLPFPSWTWLGWDFSRPDYPFCLHLGTDNVRLPWFEGPSKFSAGTSILKSPLSLVDIDVQMSGGATLPWATAGSHIIDMTSSGGIKPEALHISGFTVDARLEECSRYHPSDLRRLDGRELIHNETPFLRSGAGFYELFYLATASRLEATPSYGLDKRLFSVRFVILGLINFFGPGELSTGELPTSDRSLMLIMVMHRKLGSTTWERLNVLQCSIYNEEMWKVWEIHKLKTRGPLPGSIVDDREFQGWKWMKTVVV
ncbi:hypothetical protein OQA88_6945 [Cercophora sp. LCS_1]